MKKRMLAVMSALLAGCSMSADTRQGEQAVAKFHALLDQEQFDAIYRDSSADMKKTTQQEEFVRLLAAVHRKLGTTESSTLDSWRVSYLTSGTSLALVCRTKYRQGDATEQFLFRLEGDKAALDRQERFVCPSPGKVVYESWGPRGLSKACVVGGTRNGSFFAAEQGHVAIRGNYENGQKQGSWEWLDSSGNIVRRGQDSASDAK